MKGVAGELPAGPGWSYEVKWDGMRVLAGVSPAGVRLWSARGAEVTTTFPELAALAGAAPGHDVLLDGEVVATDEQGVPRFALLQQRLHVSDPAEAARRARSVPVAFVAFDLLSLDDRDLTTSRWTERRDLLEEVLVPGPGVRLSGRFDDGAALLEVVTAQGLEGVVAKRVDAPYRPGARSPAWRKVKVRHEQEFVVVGWLGGTGARVGAIGSLVLACRRDGRLRWAGNVGTGFTDVELRRLGARLDDLATDDPAVGERVPTRGGVPLHWVRPELVVQVAYAEWTPDGRLRHPSYLGERTDVAAEEVTCDP
ncbi:MAG: non-homologous end-joining DNA ligase [Microthrixaceae bacterium]